ncbi:PTS transporter subunit EIIC [Lactobacillus sp. R2/2]|nr:PTS transporter subunit EIIC [Lactobacillus sp. R2/2]
MSISSTLAPDKTGQWHIALSDLSSNSMFAAIIVALVSVQITHFMNKHKMTIKLPSSVPPNVTAPFEALLPLVFNILFWIILDSLSKTMFNVGLSNLIFKLFEPILHVGASLPAMMFLSELALIFWFLVFMVII